MNGTEHMQEREQQKENAITYLEQVIAGIEAERREPDAWERCCLANGIASASRGLYDLAWVDADLALTPEDKRSPTAKLDANTYSLAQLKDALVQVKTEPVQPFRQFGPVIYRGDTK